MTLRRGSDRLIGVSSALKVKVVAFTSMPRKTKKTVLLTLVSGRRRHAPIITWAMAPAAVISTIYYDFI